MALLNQTEAARHRALQRHRVASLRTGSSSLTWLPAVTDWIGLAAVLVTATALAPAVFVVQTAITAGWSTFVTLVFRARVAELLVNTVALIFFTLPACGVIAVALAWLVERSDVPGRRLLAWLAIAPLAIPAFVHSYAWIGAFPGMGGIWAGVFVATLAYFPFLYLPVAATLQRLDPALEDVAASMGLGPRQVFTRVVLPQLRIPLCGGGLLIGIHLLAEYGLFAMMRFDTFTTAIVDQFEASYNGPAAIMLALVLIAGCGMLLALEAFARGDRRYARVGRGAPRLHTRIRLGRMAYPSLIGALFVVGLALAVPVLTLGRWLWFGGIATWADAELASTLLHTLQLASIGAALTTLAAFPAAWISVRRTGMPARLVEAASYFVGAIPGVIVALALVAVTVHYAHPLYQTEPALLLAYGIMFLPRAITGLRGSLAQVPKALEEVAGSLGRSPLRAVRDVTLRLAAPGVGSALALVALGIANELTATLMLAPNGTRTLATQFWAYSSEIDYVAAAPYAVLMVLLSAPMTIMLCARR
ncbi:MAG: ABC transporter permease [Hyphomicrobiaceae bacterium]